VVELDASAYARLIRAYRELKGGDACLFHQREQRRRPVDLHIAGAQRARRVGHPDHAARLTRQARFESAHTGGYSDAPMTKTLGGPAIVLALVLAETAVGGIAVLWATQTWGTVRDGFFKITGAVLAAVAVLSWLAARAPLQAAGKTATALLGVFAALAVAWQVVLWTRARGASKFVGLAAVPVGVAALGALAAIPAAARSAPVAAFQLLAGALFAGAATDGLLLGHWYLVERKLTRDPLRRMNTLFLVGCGVAMLAAILGQGGGGVARPDLSPLLGVGGLAAWLAVGLGALCATIAFFIRALIKEDSIQAATGLFYLAVMMALAAEFAAKVRFY
jgi:hypothetical protein